MLARKSGLLPFIKLLPVLAMFACAFFFPSPAEAGIFSDVINILQGTLDSTTQQLFNGIATYLQGAIVGVLTLYIIFFALAFLAGITNIGAREFAVTLFKLGLVWSFAAFWNQGAGLAYDFFKTFAVSGGDMVWTAVGASGSGIGGLTGIDGKFDSAIGFASASGSGNDVMGVKAMCIAQLTALLVMLFIMQPALIAFVLIFVYNYIKLFATGILYYFKSLALISFLIVLSPIFVSFALFQYTQELFKTWIKHLGVNALQMLIMFAFFAMIILVDFASFFEDFVKLFRIWNPLGIFGGVTSLNLGYGVVNFQAGFCSICEYKVTNTVVNGLPDMNIVCVSDKALPPFAIPFQFEFWIWAMTKVIALQVLSYILTDFLEKSPTIAQQLGGVRFGGLLAGSGANPGFTGYTNFAFNAVNAGANAFKQAQRNAYYRPGILGAMPLVSSIRNPFTPFTHAGNTFKSLRVAAFGTSESDAGISNAHLTPFQKEFDDYSDRARKAKRALQKAGDILESHKKLEKDGKISRAALVSAQSAYNLSLANSKRWERKLDESREKLLEASSKYTSSKGGVFENALMGLITPDDLEKDYKRNVTDLPKSGQTSSMAYFLPAKKDGMSYEQEELLRQNLERMQSHGEQRLESLESKLEGSNLSAYEKSRIFREMSGLRDDLRSNDHERVSQCLETLSQISRELE